MDMPVDLLKSKNFVLEYTKQENGKTYSFETAFQPIPDSEVEKASYKTYLSWIHLYLDLKDIINDGGDTILQQRNMNFHIKLKRNHDMVIYDTIKSLKSGILYFWLEDINYTRKCIKPIVGDELILTLNRGYTHIGRLAMKSCLLKNGHFNNKIDLAEDNLFSHIPIDSDALMKINISRLKMGDESLELDLSFMGDGIFNSFDFGFKLALQIPDDTK